MESDPFSPLNDPAGDKYHFYRGSDYDQEQLSILDRYKYYNGTEGNSVSDEDSPESYSTAAKSTPDVEDINNDNTLNETESYYQYKVELRPNKMQVGSNFIADSRTVRVNLPNGKQEDVTWYQFKIPITDYQKPAVGNIDGFNSIRFIRMFMTNFSKTTFLRFATLELVKNEWREYKNSLISSGGVTGTGTIDINAVNIEENGDRTPVNYVLPPGITRSTDASQSQVIEQNEQAMSLKVNALDPKDSRAAYKTVNYDLRKYKRLQMYAHAEELVDGPTLSKGDMSVFIRFGTDYRNNYYEYEIPLTITPAGKYSNNNSSDRNIVWPQDNMFDFPLELLKNIKLNRNKAMNTGKENISYSNLYYEYDPDKPNNKVSVVGNPSLGEIKVMMIGVRNKSTSQRSGEIWVNELRLDDFNDDGGWAAKANLNIALSDLGTINISGRKETDGFGALDQGLQSRRNDTYENFNISTNLELGRFLPEKLKLSAPFYYNYSKEATTPKYNVYDSDVTLKEALSTLLGKPQKDSLRDMNRTQTITKGLAFNNVKFNIKSKMPMPYDPANFSFSYSSNETRNMNPTTAYDSRQNMKMSLSYSYSPIAKSWSPFKNNKSKSSLVKSMQQFSFNYLPTNIAFNSYLQRNYEEVKLRSLDGYSGSSNSSDLLSWSQDFYWNRDAYLTWDFTKNLKFDFQSSTKAQVEEPYTQVNKKDNPVAYQAWKDSVIRSILHFGKPLAYQQNTKLTYNIPFSYFPAVNWITSAASYEATYSWTRASAIQSSDEQDQLDLGNTISNSNSFSINSRFNLLTLYNKSAFLKKVNQKFENTTRPRENLQNNSKQRRQQTENPIDKKRKFEANIVLKRDTTVTVRHNLNSKNLRVSTRSQGKVYPVKFKRIDNNSLQILTKDTVRLQVVIVKGPDPEETTFYKIAQYASRGLMSVRSLTINYSLQSGSTIAGFKPNIGDFTGQARSEFGSAPGWKYAFGLETGLDFVERSRSNNWLVKDQTDINPALLTRTEKMDIRAQLEPVKGLKVDLEAQRSLTRNTQVEYMYSGMPKTYSGSYSITTISLATSLKSAGSKNQYYSKAFETFLNNRAVIAGRLNDEYKQLTSGNNNVDQLGDASLNSSDVLIPAFLAAYSGKSAKKMALTQFPSLSSLLPNWKMTYDGLTGLPWIRDKFKSLRLSHGYSSLYQVGAYSSYAGWTELSDDRGYIQSVLTGSYLPSSPYDISSVTMTEKFTPLIGVDGTLNNNLTFSMKYNNARTVTLSTSSYQVVEALSNELIIGMSHKIPDFNKVLGIPTKAKGVNNDLDIKADFSHKTIYALLRKIEDMYSQATSGTTINSLKVSAAYTLSKSLTLGAYLDQIMNKPLVSASSYKTTTTNFGLSLKFNLTQ
nr:MAG: cell surface protein SprA [Bacteroidales bacterium 45-6]